MSVATRPATRGGSRQHVRSATDVPMIEPDAGRLPIARNTALLSAAQATHSAMGQLAVAVASITLVRVLDVEGLLGLGPLSCSLRGRSPRSPRDARWTGSAGYRCSQPASL
ncbi:MAG: hypothetical protein ACRD2C_00140 [Acidimicrobiales bacterium]